MPQMAPINWLTLFMVFILTLLMFAALNYFVVTHCPKSFSKQKKALSINWKW